MSQWLAELIGDTPHVRPIDDLRPHDMTEACWCKPFFDEHVLVHNSMDRREEFERGRKPS